MKGFVSDEKNIILGAHLVFLLMILLPFAILGTDFEAWTEQLVSGEHNQEIAILTVTFLTLDVILPVPSSFVNMTAMLYLGPLPGFVFVFSGLSLGCILGYLIGYYFRKMLFDRFYADPAFRKLTFDLARYGFLTLVMSRGIPVVAELSVMAAGYHRYPLTDFLFATLFSNLCLAALYAAFVPIAAEINSLTFFIVTLVVIPCLAMALRYVWVKWRHRNAEKLETTY